MTIKIGIMGYGNLGKGVYSAIKQNPDMELVAVFTRRPKNSIKIQEDAKIVSVDDAKEYVDKIDVMILCGGSATDLPVQGPEFAKLFNTVDSFDTHAKIPEYFEEVDLVAKSNGHTSAISIGWDPGLFSINRMVSEAILPDGKEYTFWGSGVSQGHSDAIRRISGVKNGIQYTIPLDGAINRVRSGDDPNLETKEKHLRVCYVVLEEGVDKNKVEKEIKEMPNYFLDYTTEVNFITEDELKLNHSGMPHGGFVIRSGKTGFNKENKHIVEFSLKLDSNPEFTASILVAYARAVFKMNKEGHFGAKTVFDISLGHLSPKSSEELRKNLL
ncbi:diaminopimelate dehydrogenase [Methanococcus vannielii SB]|uniref:Meso-diaminopimelate D-dehydrogenase n=1 Tax=Methanococcus vannielii (strain ATCC 35089 / DSM 1224 / JCM 13029 / OCM 148 / SB) TaxID=406327 RepID=A6UP31_METVS|nr:diaminopimelate dehydrogenase [Methanococcus vannielii]ABR54253.1 diaminopimelate dehydrogenase [Methanococcus vannielii SB]